MKRYNMYRDPFGDCNCEVVKDSKGTYIKYDDLVKLLDRVKELEAGIKIARQYLKHDYPTGVDDKLEALLPKEKQE